MQKEKLAVTTMTKLASMIDRWNKRHVASGRPDGLGGIGPVRKGAMNEMLACAHLLASGYDVFRNMSPQGPADIVAVNWGTGERLFIDVKSGAFSIGSVDGMETMERAELLGICILVVDDNGNITWFNKEPTHVASNDDTPISDFMSSRDGEIESAFYKDADDYAKRCDI